MGLRIATASTISRSTCGSTAPSGPASGSFASMMSAPPLMAASASRGLATLMRSCTAVVVPLVGAGWGGMLGPRPRGVKAAARSEPDAPARGPPGERRGRGSWGRRRADRGAGGAHGDGHRRLERAWAELGTVHAWVNNAGADILTGPGAKLSHLEKLDLLLRVDLRGTMLASWAVAARMRDQPGGGVILNTSWDHVTFGMEGENPEMFSAVKGGVMSFSKSLARSVAPAVRVNILALGWIVSANGAATTEKPYYRF